MKKVGIVMGSDSDLPILRKTMDTLSALDIPFECHVFPTGGHGMSVCTKEVGSYNAYNARWMNWSIQWLNTLFQFEN